MNKAQVERMNKINELIKVISETDRRFFYSKNEDRVAKFVALKTTVNFIDDYTGKKVVISSRNNTINFSHGGTLWRLIKEFKEWIINGNPHNGSNGYGGLYCSHWGYTELGMKKIRDKAIEIGYMSEK